MMERLVRVNFRAEASDEECVWIEPPEALIDRLQHEAWKTFAQHPSDDLILISRSQLADEMRTYALTVIELCARLLENKRLVWPRHAREALRQMAENMRRIEIPKDAPAQSEGGTSFLG